MEPRPKFNKTQHVQLPTNFDSSSKVNKQMLLFKLLLCYDKAITGLL